MRRHNKKYRQQKNLSLIIVGCGFVILMLLVYWFVDFESKQTARQQMSLDELQNQSELITNQDVYDFINSTLVPDSIINDSLLLTKIACFSIPHTRDLKKYVKSIPDSIVSDYDKSIMRKSISKTSYLWDNKKLKNCWLISPKDYVTMNDSDTSDYWEEFRKKFGENGKHRYSVPIFNSSRNIVVIEHFIIGGWFWAESAILLYKRENDQWKLIDKKSLWVS